MAWGKMCTFLPRQLRSNTPLVLFTSSSFVVRGGDKHLFDTSSYSLVPAANFRLHRSQGIMCFCLEPPPSIFQGALVPYWKNLEDVLQASRNLALILGISFLIVVEASIPKNCPRREPTQISRLLGTATSWSSSCSLSVSWSSRWL